jgi:MOSC domain-containing protein YiiM
MKVLSVNVGLPRDVPWRGRMVRTSIFKAPVAGRVRVVEHSLEGDRQSDLTVHGGRDKAVYLYPSEHYEPWRRELPEVELAWGAFGENLTIEGLREAEVAIGDRLGIGTVLLEVTQPRMPCFKLGIRLGRADVVKRLQQSGRSGFYCAVVREGELGAGDAIEWTHAGGDRVSVADVARLYPDVAPDRALAERIARLPALPEEWRDHFRARLDGR